MDARPLTALLVLSALGAAQAADDEPCLDPKVSSCSIQNSEQASVPQIAAHPEKYWSHCVAIDGVMEGPFLFESVDGVYLRPRQGLDPSSSGFRLGLDNLQSHVSDDYWEDRRRHYQHVSIIGRVQDCETVREAVHASAAAGEIVMVSGYCHNRDGAYVWVNDLHFRSGRPFERRMGSYERPDYGDLQPAPEDWPHRAQVHALAREFLTALRAQDRARLGQMHFPEDGPDWDADETAVLDFLLTNRKSPFARLRANQTTPQQIVLVARLPLDWTAADAELADASDYSATICFCREASCTGRWPIATFDADNVASRPYACTSVGPYVVGGGKPAVSGFQTETGRGGLAEPRRTH